MEAGFGIRPDDSDICGGGARRWRIAQSVNKRSATRGAGGTSDESLRPDARRVDLHSPNCAAAERAMGLDTVRGRWYWISGAPTPHVDYCRAMKSRSWIMQARSRPVRDSNPCSRQRRREDGLLALL